MARRTSSPPPKPPDWSPEKTYAALKKQLGDLNQFRGKHYLEAQNAEQGWINFTENILTHGFGENSNNVNQFHSAKWAGEHRIGMSEGEIQRNFNARLEAFDAMPGAAPFAFNGAGFDLAFFLFVLLPPARLIPPC
jgi:hypothetical protein